MFRNFYLAILKYFININPKAIHEMPKVVT